MIQIRGKQVGKAYVRKVGSLAGGGWGLEEVLKLYWKETPGRPSLSPGTPVPPQPWLSDLERSWPPSRYFNKYFPHQELKQVSEGCAMRSGRNAVTPRPILGSPAAQLEVTDQDSTE